MLFPILKKSLCLLAAVFFVSALNVYAQTEEDLRKRPTGRFGANVTDNLPEIETQRQISPLALEAAIDPQTYILGPGDRFFVVISVIDESGFQIAVTAEGKLIVPTVGVFDVQGKTLAQVQREIKSAGTEKYRDQEVRAHIIDLRLFRVHVLGEVIKPGIYAFRQTERLSDALQAAENMTDWAQEDEIILRRKNGDENKISFSKYRLEGDLASNPTLFDGDVILVPRISAEATKVYVEGRISSPGIYAARSGETPEAFLQRIGGATRKSDLLAAVIKRPNPDSAASKEKYKIIPLRNVHAKNGADLSETKDNFVLQTGDIVSIPSISDSVYVQGPARFPGAYPYHPGFKARDYVGLAGPNDRAAGMTGVKVRHPETGEIFKGPDAPVRPGDTVEIRTAKRLVLRDYIAVASTLISASLSFVLIQNSLTN